MTATQPRGGRSSANRLRGRGAVLDGLGLRPARAALPPKRLRGTSRQRSRRRSMRWRPTVGGTPLPSPALARGAASAGHGCAARRPGSRPRRRSSRSARSVEMTTVAVATTAVEAEAVTQHVPAGRGIPRGRRCGRGGRVERAGRRFALIEDYQDLDWAGPVIDIADRVVRGWWDAARRRPAAGRSSTPGTASRCARCSSCRSTTSSWRRPSRSSPRSGC